MKWFLIVNPAAGGGKCKAIWPKVQQQLNALKISYEFACTTHAGHAESLAKEAIAKGHRHLASVGGDGTGHEVVNGILRNGSLPAEEVVYFQIPIGTGNDWPKTFGFPTDWKKSLTYLQSEKTTLQDIAEVIYQDQSVTKSRYAYNVVGLCFDAYIAKKIAEAPKGSSNKFKYLLLVLRCLHQFTAQKCTLRVNGLAITEPSYLINVGICKYSGGGMQLVPHAKPDDNILAVTHAKNMNKWDIVANLYRLYNGTIGRHPKVELMESTSLTVESEETIYVEADGEFLGSTPVQVTLAAEKLRIVAI